MIRTTIVEASYYQISFVSMDETHISPEWVNGNEVYVSSNGGIFLSTFDNEDKTVVISDEMPVVNSMQEICTAELRSDTGEYELCSPDTVLYGERFQLPSKIIVSVYSDVERQNFHLRIGNR